MNTITSKVRGILPDGTMVTEHKIKNEHGMTFSVLDYGCTTYKMIVPTRDGERDIVLGYKTPAGYAQGPSWHASIVGRVANRIIGGRFTLNGTEYQLPDLDDQGNHLHGVFSHRMFKVIEDEQGLTLTYKSPDGEDGFPGKLKATVRITLTEDNVLRYDLRAVSDKDTLCNLTNHNYYKLDDAETVLDTLLQVEADRYLPNAPHGAPDGTVVPVEGTPFDFRTAKPIGRDVDGVPGGYDHNFCLNGQGFRRVATAQSSASGVKMEVWTTQPGAQLYIGQALGVDKYAGKHDAPWHNCGGFAFECQGWPAAPNYPHFPGIELKAGEEYHEIIELRFSVVE